MNFKTVSVIGLGYIGLPTAAILASRGVNVIGVDISTEAVNTINSGGVHIVEPDLDIVVKAAVTTGKLRATTEPEPAEAFLIAVPTPFKVGNNEPDLSYIKEAIKSIAPALSKENLVILESTSPVGTTEKVACWLKEYRPDLTTPLDKGEEADIKIAHCPERVMPGSVLQELVTNDRVVGGLSAECSRKAVELYKIFVKGECITTKSRTAEMAKLTENAFRDVNIAFANELSVICEKLKINVWELIRLSNRHPRVNVLSPGPGVGGHCIAVDPWFIVSSCPEEAKLIQQARKVNDRKPYHVIDKVIKSADQYKKPVLAFLGLTFKADIDDLRESPSMRIVEEVSEMGIGEVLVVEPNITSLPESLASKGLELLPVVPALERANIIVLLVDHKEFLSIERRLLSEKVVIDTKGIF
ncbi:UDP-N-acetyl-D-mannosamine dehydrogenase [uncultured Pseudoteredinibacter sp.]|uniref:UDP-N-acetyl-D-mannosamine dehydrogenase n=1 Tax=uncultured Pseudoteredinibacter sp. TaxID=1641701 RepID=UPI00261F9E7F|nr:UDP-N-acetyl-D-mannosamine dehydrogenase [uncultured Pseudoteredinibacter sp.]